MRLRSAREKAELSLGQVEEFDGIRKQYLWKLENGVNVPPTWEILRKLAKRYRTSTDYLLCIIDDPRQPENKTLPEGGSVLLEYLIEMSEKSRADLIAVAKVLHDSDQHWLSFEIGSQMAESVSSQAELEALFTELRLLAAKLGSRKAALAAIEATLLAQLESNEE